MKKTAFSIIVLLGSFLASCSKDEVAVPVTTYDTYFGKIGTQRWYRITERWFQQGTTTPFVAVPDSLRGRVALVDSQLTQGVCVLWNVCETVDSLTSVYSNQLPLPLSSYKRVGNATGSRYDLLEELDALQRGVAYSPHIAGISYDPILRELPDVDWSVSTSSLEREYPTIEYMIKPLVVGNSWARWRRIDTTTGQPKEEEIARVVARLPVTVLAGTFDAYKLEIITQWYNPNSAHFNWTEYYVPNVGLILRESDENVCQWNSGTGGTICFRQVMRMELTSYNLIR